MRIWVTVLSLLALFAIGPNSMAGATQPSIGGTVKELFRAPVPGQPGMDTVVLRVDYAPGGVTSPHQHPGFVYAYVLSGAIVSQIDDGKVQTFKQGEGWSEQAWQHHMVSKNASSTEPASLLVFFNIQHSAPLTIFLPTADDPPK